MSRTTAIEDLLPVVTGSPAETRALGRRLADLLEPGVLVLLEGPLGAGKTQLVKGIADGLGLDGDAVSSPTFTIVHQYGRDGTVLYHVDAYRVESAAELAELGIEDVLYGGATCVIEWPERLGALVPRNALRIRLEHRSPDRRLISLAA